MCDKFVCFRQIKNYYIAEFEIWDGKKKEEYSTEAALTSLNSFADSAGMKIIYQYQFNECLLADDISDKSEEIDEMIAELTKKIK